MLCTVLKPSKLYLLLVRSEKEELTTRNVSLFRTRSPRCSLCTMKCVRTVSAQHSTVQRLRFRETSCLFKTSPRLDIPHAAIFSPCVSLVFLFACLSHTLTLILQTSMLTRAQTPLTLPPQTKPRRSVTSATTISCVRDLRLFFQGERKKIDPTFFFSFSFSFPQSGSGGGGGAAAAAVAAAAAAAHFLLCVCGNQPLTAFYPLQKEKNGSPCNKKRGTSLQPPPSPLV